MLKILAIVWQSYYNILFRASKKIKDFEVKVYSARALEEDLNKLTRVLKEIDEAEIIFLYRSNETFWEEIEKKIKNRQGVAKIICVGHDPSCWMLSNVDSEVLSKAYRYLVINGEENVINLFLFLANKLGGLNVPYEEPKHVPWEGLYHPHAGRIFCNVKEYLEWYLRESGVGISPKINPRPTIGILFSRHYWINGNTEVEDLLITELERKGFGVIPVFAYSVKDEALGAKGTGEVILECFFDEQGRPLVDAVIKLIAFFLSSEREKKKEGLGVAIEGVEILKRLDVPVFSPFGSYYKTIEEWQTEELSLDIGWSIALPEFEGLIEPIIISGQIEKERSERTKQPIEDRVKKLVERVARWMELRATPVSERKVAFVLHNSPCASLEATVGSAANLDSLESVVNIMRRMKEVGYRVNPPESGKALIDEIMKRKAISEFRWTSVEEIVDKGGVLAFVEKDRYLEWFNELPEKTRLSMIEAWGEPPGEHKNGIPPAMVLDGKIVITGLMFGNVLVMVQPKRGCAGARCDGQVCRTLHDPATPPPHHYIATYRWISREFKAHVIVHVGTHGNLEFLPGKGVGLSSACLPDIAIDTLPHLYIYNADNPPEGTVAKRRSYAVLVDHMQTVLTESGLYDEFLELDNLLTEYEGAKSKEPERLHVLSHMILDKLRRTKLDSEIRVLRNSTLVPLSQISDSELHEISFEKVIEEVQRALFLIRSSQIQDGMHVFGKVPEGERRVEFIYSILRHEGVQTASLRAEIARLLGYNLSELLANPGKSDVLTGKPFAVVIEEIDRIGKEIVRKVLGEVL